jgi:hypothetical protein
MQQEVALVASGGSGPARGPTKSNTLNYPALPKSPLLGMTGENPKTLGLRSAAVVHTCDVMSSFIYNIARQVKHFSEIYCVLRDSHLLSCKNQKAISYLLLIYLPSRLWNIICTCQLGELHP